MKKYKRNKNEKQYIPRNTEKYCGQYPIICRSSWEYKFATWLDYNKDVLEWASEGIRIPYFDPVKNKNRIYYPDFFVKFKNRKKFIVEIKPEKHMRLPRKKGKKSDKTMMIREATYLTNQAKFKAATQYCKKFGYIFEILTEKDLFRGN